MGQSRTHILQSQESLEHHTQSPKHESKGNVHNCRRLAELNVGARINTKTALAQADHVNVHKLTVDVHKIQSYKHFFLKLREWQHSRSFKNKSGINEQCELKQIMVPPFC